MKLKILLGIAAVPTMVLGQETGEDKPRVDPLFPGVAPTDLIGIPSVPFKRSGTHVFNLSKMESITVDARHASSRDEDGATLIPPTLLEFAATFAQDMETVFAIRIKTEVCDSPRKNSIFVTLGDKSAYRDAAGRPTREGYSLTVNGSGIFVTGASPLGVWWATRTILQQAALCEGGPGLPYGSAHDMPGWGERGMMLDVARHYYPKSFIVEMCSYMSFFKQNTLQLHLSDNLSNNKRYSREQSLELDAWFRPWSDNKDLEGLNTRRNESYTRVDFDEIQSSCAARGVTILPEIEAPGHALRIVQWRPQLGLESDLSLLNISHPDTIPTMKMIWREFLPWFHSKTVSIGADEYRGPVKDYNLFVNALDDFIRETSNKSVRIWGTFPPSFEPGYVNVHQRVSVQHWEFIEDNPYHDFIRNNYSVLNSNDDFYTVTKWGGYPNTIDIAKTFHGDPARGGGGPWYPHMFSQKNEVDNPPRHEPLVLGAIAPLWNDFGSNTSVYSEAYYAWREGLPALADKQWGGTLTREQFDEVFPKLHSIIPAQNLDRSISSNGSVIFDYDLNRTAEAYGTVRDVSPNGYDAQTDCQSQESALRISPNCSLVTPWASKGRDYTLTMTLKIEQLVHSTDTTLVAGSDSVLVLTPNITLLASGNYYRLNISLPVKQWVELSVRGRGNQTFASVRFLEDNAPPVEEEFRTRMGINGQSLHWDVMAIEAPIQEVTGWFGELKRLRLTSRGES